MISLEQYSRNELKKLAADKGLANYHNLSRADLIKQLNEIMNATEAAFIEGIAAAKEIETVEAPIEEEVKKVKKKVAKEVKPAQLSMKALQWKNYLQRVNITPEVFLKRFPDHIEKNYIEELI